MDSLHTSRSHRFFLYLDPASPPPVRDICFHWNQLGGDNLNTEQWGSILQRLVAVIAGMDNIDRQVLADAVKHPTRGLPTYVKAHEAIFYASNPSDILAGMQFFARHNEKVSADFFEEAHLKLRRYLPYLPATDLSSILFSFGKSRYLPHEDFWDDFQQAWQEKFASAEADDIHHVYERAAKLALPMSAKMIDFFDSYIRSHANELPVNLRDKLLWTSAMIDNIHGGTALAATVPALLKAQDMGNATMRNTVRAWYSVFDLPPLREKGGNSSSRSEKRLREIFEDAGKLRPEKDHILPYVASPVDMRLAFKGHDVIVEMDGITHFNFDFSGERRYNGQTLLNSAVKTKIAGTSRLLHIDDRSYSYLFYRCAVAEQDRIAHEILDTAISKEPGNYRVIIAPERILFDSMKNNNFIPS
ncbi:MAG: hypothetical protein DI586_08665 [Micavibrio aeruginosavorus]|uniref:Uncharacterized protein n=1 Tax=Micavibrio aeruginosavorus TaxID=349221 RepID=A0A2W5FIS5_9BACT|nr:MAG: hypothetical protein DI586_08665 [Micavibrio aeruginosavorus]